MTRDDKIKEILYDISRTKGNFDLLADILLKPVGYTIMTEFSITQDESEDEVLSAEFDLKMSKKNDRIRRCRRRTRFNANSFLQKGLIE